MLTDLLMALEVSSVVSAFIEYANDALKLDLGLATWNSVLVRHNLERGNVRPAFVVTPVNVNGFDMNPSQREVETALKEYDGDIIATNVLGGGAVSLEASSAYISAFDRVTRRVVGASSNEHLSQLREAFS